MVLFCLLQRAIRFELHVIKTLKPFFLRLGEADATVCFDILNLIITNDYYCNNLTVGASLWITLFFPGAYMQSPSNMHTARAVESLQMCRR